MVEIRRCAHIEQCLQRVVDALTGISQALAPVPEAARMSRTRHSWRAVQEPAKDLMRSVDRMILCAFSSAVLKNGPRVYPEASRRPTIPSRWRDKVSIAAIARQR